MILEVLVLGMEVIQLQMVLQKVQVHKLYIMMVQLLLVVLLVGILEVVGQLTFNTIKINQLAVNNSITGFTFEYSDNGSDYTSVGTFSVTAATSTQTVSVLNTAGKHRYWRLKSTTNTTGGQSSYRWVVAFLGFFSEPITTDSPTQNFPTVNISGPYIGSQQSAAQGNLKIVPDGWYWLSNCKSS